MTATTGAMRVEMIQNNRSRLPRNSARDSAYAAMAPSETETPAEPREAIKLLRR